MSLRKENGCNKKSPAKTWGVLHKNQDKGLSRDMLVILAEFSLKSVAWKQLKLNPAKLLWWYILCSKPAPDQASSQAKINPSDSPVFPPSILWGINVFYSMPMVFLSCIILIILH